MQLTKGPGGRDVLGYVVTLSFALVFLVIVGLPAAAMSNFYSHLMALNDDLRRRDVDGAKSELAHVSEFYRQSQLWGVAWLADAYLFRDAFLHRASSAYLTGDYESIVRDLKDRIDDPRAAYLLGCAKFRIAQRRYRAITGRDPQAMAEKAAILREVLEQVSGDFERALRTDNEDRFDYKWNYDVTTDAEATKRALELPPQPIGQEVEQVQVTSTSVRRRRG